MTTAPPARRLIAPLLLSLLACAPLQAAPPAVWAARLTAELEQVDAQNRADIGVYVRDLETGAAASYRADETWYLASTVKLPVAITVLRAVERGDFTLDKLLTLRADDIVDGTGQTNGHAVGTPLTIRYLIEQMMVYSDNTASDMLIGLVGLARVNALVQSLVPHGFQPITTLADVRRHVYGQLDPAATRLSGKDFLVLKAQRTDLERRQALGRLLHSSVTDFRMASVADGYDAYYASGLNSGRLDAYGELLGLLARGKALGPAATGYLLDVMDRVKTGPHRIKAGLPPFARFAHKTGTQSARTCDSGVISVPRPGREPGRVRQIVVAACTRGEFAIAGSDRALRQVGTAICRSGVLFDGTTSTPPHEVSCFVDPRAAAAPVLPELGTGER